MEKVFLNVTNHILTKDQLFILGQAGFTIVEKEAIFDDDVLEHLKQSPASFRGLEEVSRKAVEQIKAFLDKVGAEIVYIHLPIGSPAFQVIFFADLVREFKSKENVKIVFSHTRRIVEEENGKKISVFKFEKFIEINPKEINC